VSSFLFRAHSAPLAEWGPAHRQHELAEVSEIYSDLHLEGMPWAQGSAPVGQIKKCDSPFIADAKTQDLRPTGQSY
jgi:hypothetical protein